MIRATDCPKCGAPVAQVGTDDKIYPRGVRHGVLYLTTGSPAYVVALEVDTGKVLWSTRAPGANGWATLGEQRVYLRVVDGNALPIDLLDVKTGALVGRLAGASTPW